MSVLNRQLLFPNSLCFKTSPSTPRIPRVRHADSQNKSRGLGGDPEKSSRDLLDAAHAMPQYKEFISHPDLREFVRAFMSWKKEILVTRALLRHNCPNSESTGIHYDQLFLRAVRNDFLPNIYCFGYSRRVAMRLAASMSKTYPFTHEMYLKREWLTWKSCRGSLIF